MTACGLCEREQHGDGYLCPGCTKGTVERLDALPRLYVALAAFLQPARGGGGGPVVAAVEARLPCDESVFSLRGPGGMVGVLEDWRSALHVDLDWSQPRPRGTFEQRVTAAAGALRLNMLWIAESWPAADTFAQEIRGLHRSATSVVAPQSRTGIRLGYCPAVYEDGVICGSVLRLPPGESVVICRWCGATYPPGAWLALASAQDALTMEAS
ncbi:hypothetical protein [Streptomyces sp. H39-C1]|uniref:hypothetical protein n=1 Tax=Streptomyces sp. H39-C1 TaxID=3004355 RepID=UPI0022AF91E3|nr:hypothetical protein [Streptomyces sp. H39-C1]MCZ4099866.1 hypothetical protein [Streptomyces sp. H39-C1]